VDGGSSRHRSPCALWSVKVSCTNPPGLTYVPWGPSADIKNASRGSATWASQSRQHSIWHCQNKQKKHAITNSDCQFKWVENQQDCKEGTPKCITEYKILLLLSVGFPLANAPDVLQPCCLLYYPYMFQLSPPVVKRSWQSEVELCTNLIF